MSTLSAVISCDTTQFNRAINKAKETLEKYKNKTDNASKSIQDNVTVSNSQIASYNRVIRTLDKVASGTMTTTQQEKALTNQIKELKMQWANLSSEAKRSDFGRALSESCRTAQSQLRQIQTQMSQVSGSMKGIGGIKTGSGFMSLATSGIAMATGIGTAAAAFDVLKGAIMDNIETASNFEASVSRITSLTGASSETIDSLKRSAMELGATTTQSASEVMEAFGMIGSKSPSLLGDADALAEVTKNCIMLSEAANMDLGTAATAVTGILNQFGIEANRSAEIVNLLAAASQQGAGDVGYLNTAIVNCGSVAGTLGISVNQVVAVLEQLAQSGVDASSAGNQLKNIMLKLESSSDNNLKPSVVGLTTALQNLGNEHLSTTDLTKKFGTENVAAALTLIKTAESAEKLTQSITGTNTAEEQQKTNNDNLQGSLKNLSSKWEAFNLAINEGNGLIRSCVDVTADLVGWLTKLISKTDDATEARKRLNRELGGDGSKESTVGDNVKRVGSKGTKGQKIGEFNKIKHTYDRQIKDYNKQIGSIDKKITEQQKIVNKSQGHVGVLELKRLQTHRNTLAAERRAIMADQRKFIKGGIQVIRPIKPAPGDGDNNGNGNGNGSGGGGTVHTSHTPKIKTDKTTPKVEVEPVVDPNSLKGIEDQISKKQAKLKLSADPDERKKLKSEIDELTDKKNIIEFDTNFNSGTYDKLIQSIDKAVSETDEFKASAISGNAIIDANNQKIKDNNTEIERLAQVLKQLQEEYKKLGETINSEAKLDIDTSDEVQEYNKLGDAIQQVSDKMSNLKSQNGKLVDSNNSVEKGIKKTTKHMDKLQGTSKGIGSIADMFGDISQVTKGTAKAVFGVTNAVLSGASQMIDQIMQIQEAQKAASAANIATSESEAIASGTKSAAGAPWFMVIPLIATIVGTITAIFSSLNSYADGGVIPKYADGGVFSGATSIGDYNLARVNGGEMILNGSQQRRLFNILNGSNGTAQSSLNGKVEFKISGSDLKGVLRNYDKKMSVLR